MSDSQISGTFAFATFATTTLDKQALETPFDISHPVNREQAAAIRFQKRHLLDQGLSPAVRAHVESHTVPGFARKFEPDLRVWEQDGFLVRVETNGKQGRDGYYRYESTKL